MHKPSLRFAVSMLGLAAAIAAFAQTPPTVTLKVGSQAPPMTVKKWVKGTPVTKLGNGAVTVVEFWATWCGPCRESIPHLTELAHKYKGKATFAGISVSEEPDPKSEAYMSKVDSFVKDMGDKMDYNVGADGMSGTMNKTWMEAAGQDGIPTAFVIDQKGTVAWIGHPMDGLDEVVGAVIDGKYDAKAEADRKVKEELRHQEFQKDLQPVEDAMQAKKFDSAVRGLDGVIAKYPELADKLAVGKVSILLQFDEPGAYTYAKTLVKGSFKDNAEMLDQIGLLLINIDGKMKHPDYATSLMITKRAVDASSSKDPIALHLYSIALFKLGEADSALTAETKALAVATASPDTVPDGLLKDIHEHLAIYKAKVAKAK